MIAFLLVACLAGCLAAMWEYATLRARSAVASGPPVCGSCGYSRAGLASGAVCPECGSTSIAAARRLDIAGYWRFIHALLAGGATVGVAIGGGGFDSSLAIVGVVCFLVYLPLSGFGKALARRGNGDIAQRMLILGTGIATAAMIGAGIWTFETCDDDALSLGLGILTFVPLAGFAASLWSIPIGHFLVRRPTD